MMRLCDRCQRPVKPPHYLHYACQKLEDAEFKARIEALPEKPMTLEVWCRMWGMSLDEGRESYAKWQATHG